MNNELMTYKNWKIETDTDGVAWLGIDKENASANVLSRAVLEELDTIITSMAAKPPEGVVIYSCKKSGFIAGADVNEFSPMPGEAEALTLIKRGQGVMDAIEALPCPVVAAIHGFCLGGGMELALACHYRVCTDDVKTKLGLPEVMLGIHPGFGGTVRLTRVVGSYDAMNAMLTGRPFNAKAARKLGLVEYAVPLRHLKTAAKSLIEKRPPRAKPSLIKRLPLFKPARTQLARLMVGEVSKKAPKRHYPAPYALIDLWVEHFGDERRMLDEEAKSVARLIAGDTAQNLVRLFFLQERMKGSAEGVEYKPALVHVVGAGVMGGDIAAWIALRGFRVTLQDTEPARVAPAIKRAYKLFKKKLKEPRLVQAAMDRLIPDTASDGVASADLVIEAIFESLEAKQSLFADIEPRMKPDAILATNTSSIPLEDMAAGLKNPERLVGLHFFNPVAQMKLVEVVRGAATSSGTVLKAAAFVKGIDRLPLVVKSAPGFLVNRILMPYLMEAMTMIEEGVSPVDVDAAALDFGMPMGPVTLADAVGLDICLHVGDILSTTMGWPSPPKRLRSMVESGKLGKKSGTGFYDFKKGKPVAPKLAADRRIPEGIGDRLLFRLVNEAVACIREGVVEDADLLDAGIVFGTGFAPFRGGPMNYVRNYGIEVSRKKLAALQKGYGARFAEDSGWATLEL